MNRASWVLVGLVTATLASTSLSQSLSGLSATPSNRTVTSTPPIECSGSEAVLVVTPDRPVMPGDTIWISFVTDLPDAYAILGISTSGWGTTTVPWDPPMGGAVLCLDSPALLPVGMTDASGTMSLSLELPNLNGLMGVELFLQGLVFLDPSQSKQPPPFSSQTTNVDTLVF